MAEQSAEIIDYSSPRDEPMAPTLLQVLGGAMVIAFVLLPLVLAALVSLGIGVLGAFGEFPSLLRAIGAQRHDFRVVILIGLWMPALTVLPITSLARLSARLISNRHSAQPPRP